MKKIKLLFAVYALVCICSINAQNPSGGSLNNVGDNENNGKWLLSFGLNIVQDGGTRDIGDLLDSPSSSFSNPFIVGAEYYTSTNFSVNTSVSFNKSLEGKSVDGGIIQKGNEAGYFAFDAAAKYSFKEILNTKVFDPYLVAGTGYTNIGEHTSLFGTELTKTPAIGRMTLNYGFGANFWVSNSWGVNLNIMGKNGINQKKYKEEITNQIQFSFGGVYRITNKNMNWRG